MPDKKLTDVTDIKVGKMTDSEIVKALECCCGDNGCFGCSYAENHNCRLLRNPIKDALDLINRLQAEKKELVGNIDRLKAELFDKTEQLKTAKAKALKEAASKFAGHSDYHGDTILCKLICMAEGKEVKVAKPLDKSEIKAEAYKECIEKAKSEIDRQPHSKSLEASGERFRIKQILDNLLKELVGDNNGIIEQDN